MPYNQNLRKRHAMARFRFYRTTLAVCIFAAATLAVQAQVFTTLFEFDGTTGAQPIFRVIQ